jgi:hypothetical protein
LISLLLLAGAAQGKSYWVFFRDRAGRDHSVTGSLDTASVFIDPHTRERRRIRGIRGETGEFDIPISAEYKRRVLGVPGVSLRGESRWLNALSVEADPSSLEALARLSCVQSIRPVRRFESNRRPDFQSGETFAHRSVRERWVETGDFPDPFPTQPDPAVSDPYWRMDRAWYGPSLNQVRMVNALEAHSRGNHGAGVRIAVLDGGFQLNHEAFQGMDVIAQYDFINNDDYTGFDPKQDTRGQAHHGTACSSVIGGYSPGNLIGLAHEAAFILCKTEDDRSETPIEEDYWVRALEWAEALGADVLSSSLSYKDWYNPADYDGLTAPTSRAATIAYELGMVLCTSAGNEGPEPMTLGVPADAEGLLAIGAVRYNGDLAPFSSRGPTADGRIKPDVLAQGVRTCCVSPDTWDRYAFWNGTSLSCPVAAGCMALILAEHPDWGPDRIAEAVRETASRAERPDPDWGWGIINVEAAIQYPSIAGWVVGRSGEGLPDVQVQLFGEDQVLSVLTGANGYYIFPNLDGGEFRIQVIWGDAEKSPLKTLLVPPSEEIDFRWGE